MPARLAAMPRTPAERGAGTGGRATRVAERLTRSDVLRPRAGWGVPPPLNVMLPNTAGARGAWAAEGATATTPRATCVVVLGVGAVAEAGSASEAAMAPDITITAETLVAGIAEREIAAVKEEAELGAPNARWRPAVWLDKW